MHRVRMPLQKGRAQPPATPWTEIQLLKQNYDCYAASATPAVSSQWKQYFFSWQRVTAMKNNCKRNTPACQYQKHSWLQHVFLTEQRISLTMHAVERYVEGPFALGGVKIPLSSAQSSLLCSRDEKGTTHGKTSTYPVPFVTVFESIGLQAILRTRAFMHCTGRHHTHTQNGVQFPLVTVMHSMNINGKSQSRVCVCVFVCVCVCVYHSPRQTSILIMGKWPWFSHETKVGLQHPQHKRVEDHG